MFEKLASDFYVPVDFNVLETLPEYEHVYGDKQMPPSTPHWMTYSKPRDDSWGLEPGKISFTRLTGTLMPEFVSSVVKKLEEKFGNVVPWDKDRVHIIRTTGFILPHVDEIRTAVINIGLKNSSSAETKFARSGSINDFRTGNVNTYICQDGGVYVLDVSKYHAVYSVTNSERYLITYGFGITYDELIKLLK